MITLEWKGKEVLYLYCPRMSSGRGCIQLYFPEISPYTNIGYKCLFSEGLKYGMVMENCLPPTTCQAHHLQYL